MRTIARLTILTLALAAGGAVGAESFVIAKIVDRADAVQISVLSATDLKALQGDIQAEARVQAKALDLARAAWQKDPANTKPFPAGAVARRSVNTVGSPFKTLEEAEEKCARMVERAAIKATTDEAEQVKRQRARYENKEDGSKKMAEQRARDVEKKTNADKARALYETQLATLTGKPVAPVAPAAAPAAPGH